MINPIFTKFYLMLMDNILLICYNFKARRKRDT